MATRKAIGEVFVLFKNAPLRGIPENLVSTAAVWDKVFARVNDQVLTMAAEEYILREKFWPAPAELREWTTKVNQNLGQALEWKSSGEPVPFMAVVTDDGWVPVRPESFNGARPATRGEITAWDICARADREHRELTDDEHAQVQQLLEEGLQSVRSL